MWDVVQAALCWQERSPCRGDWRAVQPEGPIMPSPATAQVSVCSMTWLWLPNTWWVSPRPGGRFSSWIWMYIRYMTSNLLLLGFIFETDIFNNSEAITYIWNWKKIELTKMLLLSWIMYNNNYINKNVFLSSVH